MKNLILLFCVAGAVMTLAGELPGTRLHYDFEKLHAPGVLEDLSGNGHHGRMQGTFRDVSCGNARGVAFNGKDTVVKPDKSAELKASGPFSIFVSLRITPEAARRMRQRSPHIFGAVDGKSVNRNYTLFFDGGAKLQLNVGNGKEYSFINLTNIADGKVHHIAYVVASPLVLVFKDGQCVHWRSDFSIVPNKSIGEPTVQVGDWHSGHFDGELYDLRFFGRMLNNREIQELSGNGMQAEGIRGDLRCRHSNVRNCLEWEYFCAQIPAATTQIELQLDGRMHWSRSLTREELAAGRLFIRQQELPTESISLGEHRVSVVLRGHAGDLLQQETRPFSKARVADPEKYSNSIGVSQQVLPPWTPMGLRQEAGKAVVSVWNREYSFSSVPFEMAMRDRVTSLTSSPASCALVCGGRNVEWKQCALAVRQAAPHCIVLEQRGENEKLSIKVTHTIEYDGFDRVKVELQAKEKVTLNALSFRFFLEKGLFSQVIRRFREIDTIDRVRKYGFCPGVFLGSEERGFSYIAESDQYWFPKDRADGIVIIPDEKHVEFALHPVVQDVAMEQSETFVYEMGISATPYKAAGPTGWTNRFARICPYCSELQCQTNMRGGKSALNYYAEAGMRGFTIWRTGKAFGYPPIPESPFGKDVAALVKSAHERNLRVFPYAISFLFSEFAPEWNERRLFLVEPLSDFSRDGDYLETESGHRQHAYHTCNREYYQNLMLYRLKEAILKTDIDGVYLDSTADTILCMNPVHGCGYTDRDGRRRGTYASFANREFLKRIYTLVYQLKGESGVVDLHCSSTCQPPSFAWATSLWLGENLGRNEFAFKALPPNVFRVFFTGRNIGTDAELLYYAMRCSFRSAAALAFVHNTAIRASEPNDIDALKGVWLERERLGCDEAEFIGYWQKDCPVAASLRRTYVSAYRRKDGSLVAIVANLSPEKETVRLRTAEDQWILPAAFELDSQEFRYVELPKKTDA